MSETNAAVALAGIENQWEATCRDNGVSLRLKFNLRKEDSQRVFLDFNYDKQKWFLNVGWPDGDEMWIQGFKLNAKTQREAIVETANLFRTIAGIIENASI